MILFCTITINQSGQRTSKILNHAWSYILFVYSCSPPLWKKTTSFWNKASLPWTSEAVWFKGTTQHPKPALSQIRKYVTCCFQFIVCLQPNPFHQCLSFLYVVCFCTFCYLWVFFIMLQERWEGGPEGLPRPRRNSGRCQGPWCSPTAQVLEQVTNARFAFAPNSSCLFLPSCTIYVRWMPEISIGSSSPPLIMTCVHRHVNNKGAEPSFAWRKEMYFAELWTPLLTGNKIELEEMNNSLGE